MRSMDKALIGIMLTIIGIILGITQRQGIANWFRRGKSSSSRQGDVGVWSLKRISKRSLNRMVNKYISIDIEKIEINLGNIPYLSVLFKVVSKADKRILLDRLICELQAPGLPDIYALEKKLIEKKGDVTIYERVPLNAYQTREVRRRLKEEKDQMRPRPIIRIYFSAKDKEVILHRSILKDVEVKVKS